jgi:micrococcal nuclease
MPHFNPVQVLCLSPGRSVRFTRNRRGLDSPCSQYYLRRQINAKEVDLIERGCAPLPRAPAQGCVSEMTRNPAAMLPLGVLLSITACSNVTVNADNQYGHPRGMVGVPIETVTDQVKAIASPKQERITGPLSAQVVSVHDGGTITVLIDGRKEQVRLIGIDAPELDQKPWGPQASDALALFVENKTVRLETDITVRDQYKRLLAYVFIDDIFVNLEMISQGQAVLYTIPPNIAHVEELRLAQDEARQKGYGVWNPAHPLDVMPDCYRRQKKGGEC